MQKLNDNPMLALLVVPNSIMFVNYYYFLITLNHSGEELHHQQISTLFKKRILKIRGATTASLNLGGGQEEIIETFQ